MSADNWTYCPKCKPKGDLTDEELYGGDTTLREDYEQGMQRNGVYYLFYSCRCTSCGFSWQKKIEEKVT